MRPSFRRPSLLEGQCPECGDDLQVEFTFGGLLMGLVVAAILGTILHDKIPRLPLIAILVFSIVYGSIGFAKHHDD